MNINSLIERDFETVTPFHGVEAIKSTLLQKRALVVMDHDVFVGILAIEDLAMRNHLLVIDCLSPKPVLYKDQSLTDCLNAWENHPSQVLPVLNSQGNLEGLLFYHQLIRRLFQALNDRIEDLQRIAHDLRSPISNLRTLGSMLEKKGPQNTSEIIHYLNLSCDSAREMIDDLAQISMLELQEELQLREFVNLSKIISEVTEEHQIIAKDKQVTLNMQLPVDELSITGDPVKIKSAVYNLVCNAVKFTPENKEVLVSLSQKNGTAEITVKDQGIGIPDNIQNKLFMKDPDVRRTGLRGEPTTGLGLYIVKKIMKLHEGTVDFTSVENLGTTFRLVFPLSKVEAGKNKEEASVDRGNSNN